MTGRRRLAGITASLTFALAMLFAGQSWGQAKGDSPAYLISLLEYSPPNPQSFLADCGSGADDYAKRRGWARSLAALGPAAVPAIEEVLDSAEAGGTQSKAGYGFGWLLHVYAKVRGGAALPRLRRMMEDPELKPYRYTLSDSLALSLGPTSYDASSVIPHEYEVYRCEYPTPRDSLDRLILAWERNERSVFEDGLGPNAKAAMIKGGGWLALKTELWRDRSSDGAAVGYRFEIAGPWSEPERLPDELAWPLLSPKIDTAFANRFGVDCGRQTVKFLTPGPARKSEDYLIDNSDLPELLRIVTSCATDTAKRPFVGPVD